MLCAIVGIVAGLGGILFEFLVAVAKYGLMDGLAGYRPPAPGGEHTAHLTSTPFRAWVLALLPVFGGLVGGWLVFRFAPEAEGHGTDSAIDAYHNKRGRIRARVPLIKTIASAITLGTGGSAGREGPIAQIGAGFGSVLSGWLGLSVDERRMLMIAGVGAGIGAVFRAPLAGALFAAEVLYQEMDIEFEVLVPTIIASIVAYSVFTMAYGTAPLFSMPGEVTFGHPSELIPYTALAMTVALGAWIFVRSFYGVRDMFAAWKISVYLKPIIGGVVVGSFAFFLPEALASGYGLVQKAISDPHNVGIGLLVAVVLGKVITTSFTVGSGQSGGVYGPSVVIGGLIGALVGQLFTKYAPGISPPLAAFVVVGMAGFFSAAANTPISTIIMVSEMTGNYDLLVPTMWVSVIAFMIVRHTTLYENQVVGRVESPVHFGQMMGDVLQSLSVRVALKDQDHEPMVTVGASWPLHKVTQLYMETNHTCFPVLDGEGRLLGVIDERGLRRAVATEELDALIVAADLIEKAPVLTPEDTLHEAMHRMVESKHDELVVVATHDDHRVIGSLSRRDLIAAYDHQIRQNMADKRTAKPIWATLTERVGGSQEKG